jgi:hypothetical protein
MGYLWSIYQDGIGLEQMESDWHVLSWSAKWLGAPANEVMYQDQRNAKNIEDDKQLLKGIWNLLNEADVVVTQNGKKFDAKKLNARFIINGFKPPSATKHIDTLEIAKKYFGFTSNKLAYMSDKLCKRYKKLEHEKFAGFKLWRECLKGNRAAWKEMEKYNKHDVLALEELYGKMIPWDNRINFSVYSDGKGMVCSCGSKKFKKNGVVYTALDKFQRYRCDSCGAERRGSSSLLAKGVKKRLGRNIPRE